MRSIDLKIAEQTSHLAMDSQQKMLTIDERQRLSLSLLSGRRLFRCIGCICGWGDVVSNSGDVNLCKVHSFYTKFRFWKKRRQLTTKSSKAAEKQPPKTIIPTKRQFTNEDLIHQRLPSSSSFSSILSPGIKQFTLTLKTPMSNFLKTSHGIINRLMN